MIQGHREAEQSL